MDPESIGIIALAIYRPDPMLLQAQIRSLTEQTATDWRCIVGIDGNDASTRNLLNDIISGDPRYTVIEYAQRVGFYRNFERILQEVPADAAWVSLADQDDYWYPSKLEMMLPKLSNATLVACQANLRVVGSSSDERGRIGTTDREYSNFFGLVADNTVTGSLSVFRRDLLDLALPFPNPTDAAFHDHWLGLCAAATGGIRMMPEALQDYVQHGSNVIGEESHKETFRAKLDRLREKADTPNLGRQLDYVARERWGWRVSMCRELSVRQTQATSDVTSVTSAVSKGYLNIRLISLFIFAFVKRTAPRMRILGLMIGSLRHNDITL